MQWLRHLALFVVFVTGLLRPAATLAFVSGEAAVARTRVRALGLVVATILRSASGVSLLGDKRQVVDVGRGSVRASVDLMTASGEAVASASRVPEGWTFGGLVARSRVTGETRHTLRPTEPATTNPGTMDYASLFVGASQVGLEVGSTMGFEPESRTTFHEGVERQLVKTLALSGGLMALTTTENGSNSTRTWMDSGKKVVAFDDEEARRYAYTYDAFGRVREVTLPDGMKHRAMYDGHGRLWRVERDGVAAIENVFDATTGLPIARKYFTHAQYQPANALVRTVNFAYDSIGRVTSSTHVGEGGATKVFTAYYDGATPEEPGARSTLGLLSTVTGEGYRKRLEYRADGKPTLRTVRLGDWRTVETTWSYLEGGVVGARTAKVFDGAGALLSTTAHGHVYDANGRLQTATLNGQALATLAYDVNGNLGSATFANGDSLTLKYDDLTRRRRGSTQSSAAYVASTDATMSTRGLIEAESFTVAGTSLKRDYRYSARRHLESSKDAQNEYGYGFNEVGLPKSVTKNGSTKSLSEWGDTLTAGAVTYGFDGLHRTISRSDTAAPGQDLSLTYGPDGEVATARKGGVTFGFVHDEGGQRLLKLQDGVPVAAYLEEGYLDATGLTERFQVEGRTVGIIKNGAFTTVATDLRGSVLAETTGEARVASPFGQRDVHTAMSAAIEYVEKGYDADLGLVRMGVRDYDPETNRFTTADPLFLESPERCLGSPVECNLYGYAAGDPVGHVDPTGKCVVTAAGINCLAYPQALNDAISVNMAQNWNEGDYAAYAAGAALQVANLANYAVGFVAQVPATAINGAARLFNGFMRSDVEQFVLGGLELATVVVTAKTSTPPGVSQLAVRSEVSIARAAAKEITSGSQVTEDVIRQAMKDAPLKSQQAGGVSLPKVQEYVDALLAGKTPPPIKVDGNMIVDGNHRYIAGQVLGQPPPIQPWAGGRPGSAVPWETMPIDPKAWP